MGVHSVAVTGASGLVGRHLLPVLAAHPDVDRVLGLDVREPDRRPRNVEFARVDIAGTELKPLLEGIDVVVHLAGVVDPVPDVGLMARVNVEGTRHVLDAAASVGARRIVRISSATVYGAWANNPVPLTEDAPLRPNPHFSPAVQGAEVERLLAEWRADHPDVTVTTLRSAPVVGPGAERLPARILLGRPPLRVRGAAMPVQVVHVDDLAAALALAATRDLPGVYNVAADGWLDAVRRTGADPAFARARAPGRGARAHPRPHLGAGPRRRATGGRAVPHPSVGDRQRQAQGRGLGPARTRTWTRSTKRWRCCRRRDHRPLVVMGVTAVATTVIVVSYRRRRRAG